VLLGSITVPLAPIARLLGSITVPLAQIATSKAQNSSIWPLIGLHPSLGPQLFCILSKGIEKPCLLVNDAQAELLPGLC
jgi:hypothetical protein